MQRSETLFSKTSKVPQERFLAPSTFQCTLREHWLVTSFFEVAEKLIQILVAWSIISSLALHGAIDLLHEFYSYSTGSTWEPKCCSREQRLWYKQGLHCSQLNRNETNGHIYCSMKCWRLLTKLSESVSTYEIVQKMWLQQPFFYACSKRF